MFNTVFNLFSYFFVLLLKFTTFFNMSIFLSKIPFLIGNKLRYYFYKNSMSYVGSNVLFSYGTIFSHKDISIGNNVRFGPFCTVGLVDFGDNVLIGQYSHFLSGKNQHYYTRKDIPINQQGGENNRIKLNDDIWIGTGSIIMIDIAKGTVVAAGSIVTRKFSEYQIIAGNPAIIIKSR